MSCTPARLNTGLVLGTVNETISLWWREKGDWSILVMRVLAGFP